MRTILLLSSLTAIVPAIAAATHDGVVKPLSRRQFDLGAILQGLGSRVFGSMNANPVKKENMNQLMRKDARRERIWFGPYTLPAVTAPHLSGMPLQMDPSGTQLAKRVTGFCTNCTVLYGKANLYFENGTKATAEHGVYVHHIVVVDLAKRSLPFYLCEGQSGFLGQFPAVGFIISGNDEAPNYFTTPDAKFNSGYVITKSTLLAMQAELVNYRTESQKVYIVMEYEYVQGQPSEPADSNVSLFSVTGCRFPDYHPKERVYNMTSEKVTVPMDGYIINAKGHLHDGGDYIVLKLNDKVICNSKAIYSKDNRGPGNTGMSGHGHGTPNAKPARRSADPQAPPAVDGNWEVITEMTQCTAPIKVKKGDKISMTSFYDGVKHPPRPTTNNEGKLMEADEMGVFFINYAVSNKPIEQLQVKSNQLISIKSGEAI